VGSSDSNFLKEKKRKTMPKPTKKMLYDNMKEAVDSARSRLSYLQIILDTMEANTDFINVVGSSDYRRVLEQTNLVREFMGTANESLISLMNWE
jgi:hypothetical protein